MMNILLGFFILFVSTVAKAENIQPLHLTLKEAMVMASEKNAQVIVAHQRVLQALANISVNNAALLPQISGTFGGKRQTMDLRSSGINIPGDPHVGPFNSFDTRGRITMEIFDPEAVGRLKSAKAGERLSQAQLVKVKQDVLALVGAMFLEAQRAEQAVGLTEVSLKEAQTQLQILQLRLKQGTASQSDVNKAQADLALMEYSNQAAMVHASQTRLDLKAALKIRLDQMIVFEDEEFADQELQQTALTPDEAVAQAQLEQSQFQEMEIKRGLLPKIVLAGDYGRQGKSFSESSNTYSLGAQVSVPFWEGGSKQARIAQVRAKIKEDEILFLDAQDQSQIKIRTDLENLTKAKAFLKAKTEQLHYADQQLVIDQNRLKTGLANILDVSKSESLKAMALDEKNEAQALYWTAKINLAHSMGQIEKMFELNQGGVK